MGCSSKSPGCFLLYRGVSVLSVFLSVEQPADQQDQQPVDGIHGEKHQHAVETGDDVGKVHFAGAGDLLTDLNGEAKHGHDRKDIDEGNRCDAPFGQTLKDKVHHKEQHHRNECHDDEVPVLVAQLEFKAIVDAHEHVMHLSHKQGHFPQNDSKQILFS